jgi:hypothetical protein
MTTQIILEKIGGNYLSPALPVFVYNDDGSALALSDAEDALDAAFGTLVPATANGLPPDGNYGHQQLSKSAYRFVINYREPNRRTPAPPTGSTIRPRIDCVAQRKEVRWAPEIDAFDKDGSLPFGSDFNGLVNVQFSGLLAINIGAVIDPPEPNLADELVVPTSTVTAAWRRTVAGCVGRVNTNTFSYSGGSYAPGEIFLHSVHLQVSSETECNIQIAWSLKRNVTGETRGEVTGIAYHGHHFVWEKPKMVINDDRNLAYPVPEIVIVNQVWPETDLSAIGISPPS